MVHFSVCCEAQALKIMNLLQVVACLCPLASLKAMAAAVRLLHFSQDKGREGLGYLSPKILLSSGSCTFGRFERRTCSHQLLIQHLDDKSPPSA